MSCRRLRTYSNRKRFGNSFTSKMANPRRTSYSSATSNQQQLPISDPTITGSPFQAQTQTQRLLNSLKLFLKKPHAFPLILSALLFLTWVSLRIQFQQHPHNKISSYNLRSSKNDSNKIDEDYMANLVRFSSSSETVMKDRRGWLVNPVSLALRAGLSGGAVVCESIHVGEIRPGGLRGNHRHHFCNETFIIWGAETSFRLENPAIRKGYAQVKLGSDEIAVSTSPGGTAHALLNIDPVRTTFFLGCQDCVVSYNESSTDFKVWKDI